LALGYCSTSLRNYWALGGCFSLVQTAFFLFSGVLTATLTRSEDSSTALTRGLSTGNLPATWLSPCWNSLCLDA
jgi:hypothetical protein